MLLVVMILVTAGASLCLYSCYCGPLLCAAYSQGQPHHVYTHPLVSHGLAGQISCCNNKFSFDIVPALVDTSFAIFKVCKWGCGCTIALLNMIDLMTGFLWPCLWHARGSCYHVPQHWSMPVVTSRLLSSWSLSFHVSHEMSDSCCCY